MKNKLIVKTILGCLLGAIIWCALDYIIYLIKKESFWSDMIKVDM